MVASKNNRAIDTVKEKLAALINEPNHISYKFFLRFGSREEIRNRTKPIINSYITKIHNNLIEDNSERLSQILDEVGNRRRIIVNSHEMLERKKKLENELPVLESTIEDKEQRLQRWIDSNSEAVNVFNNQREKLSEIRNRIISCKNEVASKYNSCYGLGRYYFNFTEKKKYAASLVSTFESWPYELKKLARELGIEVKSTDLTDGSTILSIYEKLLTFIEFGIQLIGKKINCEKEIQELRSQFTEDQNEIENIRANENGLKNTIITNEESLKDCGLPLLKELVHKKIREEDAAVLNRFKGYIPDYIPEMSQIHGFVETTKDFLETFNITAITSLSIKNAFPLTEKLFDIVVIDEASQCDIASALPLILRAKQLVVIGDPMQLKHISNVQSYEEKYIIRTLGIDTNLCLDYVNESLFDYCYNLSIVSKCRSIYLKEHFRCHPEIITYSNKIFYGPIMGQELDICTPTDFYQIEPKGIYWINTVGNQHPQQNINLTEIQKAVNLARKLAIQHNGISIGITTPFADQAKEINRVIQAKLPVDLTMRLKSDPVHKFQGDEKDIVILSLVVSDNSPPFKARWINEKVPFLVNVAVTRARNTLYIVGNADYCNNLPSDSPLGFLIRYIKSIRPIQNG